MGRLTPFLTGRIVAFDSAPLIYYIEAHPVYLTLADELFDSIDQGQTRGLTSVLTLLEVLVKPMRDGRIDLADAYRRLLTNSTNLQLHALDTGISERAARLRAQHNWLRTPDAIQIATALERGAEVLVTNDSRWKQFGEIEILLLKDYLTPTP